MWQKPSCCVLGIIAIVLLVALSGFSAVTVGIIMSVFDASDWGYNGY